MNKKINKLIFIVCSFLLAFFVVANIGSGITYSIMFKRVKDIDYSITPGLVCYEEVKDILPRKEYKYKSNKETLCGYYYKTSDKKPLIVVSSGYNDVSDSLISYHKFFYENGFNVFSYDNSGSGKSTGKQHGFYQSLVDLESTLNFIKSNDELNKLPLLLFGYSAGGFASTSIFNIDDYDILASVSISGYNDANELMINKGKEYVGLFSYVGLPTINIITNNKYKNYKSYTATSGINKTNTPFYIVHGTDDEVISYNKYSIINQKENIYDNCVFEEYSNKTHTSILYDDTAISYQNEVNEKLSSIKKHEEKQKYIETINDVLYSKINYTLANNVIEFYQKYI